MKRAALFCAVAGCVLLADLASLRGLPEGRWTHPPAAPAGARATASTPPPEARSSRRGRRTPRRDSVRHRVAAGDVLITTLPARVAGRRVAAYDMLRTPALSNLAGRSFFWRTRPQTREGRYRLLFRARFDTTGNAASPSAAADTLVMVVAVEPPSG